MTKTAQAGAESGARVAAEWLFLTPKQRADIIRILDSAQLRRDRDLTPGPTPARHPGIDFPILS